MVVPVWAPLCPTAQQPGTLCSHPCGASRMHTQSRLFEAALCTVHVHLQAAPTSHTIACLRCRQRRRPNDVTHVRSGRELCATCESRLHSHSACLSVLRHRLSAQQAASLVCILLMLPAGSQGFINHHVCLHAVLAYAYISMPSVPMTSTCFLTSSASWSSS